MCGFLLFNKFLDALFLTLFVKASEVPDYTPSELARDFYQAEDLFECGWYDFEISVDFC